LQLLAQWADLAADRTKLRLARRGAVAAAAERSTKNDARLAVMKPNTPIANSESSARIRPSSVRGQYAEPGVVMIIDVHQSASPEPENPSLPAACGSSAYIPAAPASVTTIVSAAT
jgi:hypothetical protein